VTVSLVAICFSIGAHDKSGEPLFNMQPYTATAAVLSALQYVSRQLGSTSGDHGVYAG